MIHPLGIQTVKFEQADVGIRDAILHQAEESGFSGPVWGDDFELFTIPKVQVRIETYQTTDIVDELFQSRWKWDCSFDSLDEPDKKRVEVILDLIQKGNPCWPYYSYWVNDMANLWIGLEPDDLCFNHGAGWHRMIAQKILGFSTVQVVFTHV